MQIDGRAAFITGGASGIGLGLARALGRRGAHVAIADLDQDRIDAALAELAGIGVDAHGLVCDVTDRDAMFRTAAEVAARLGRVDLVVNNAGVSVGGPAGAVDPRDWRWVIETNLFGVVNGVEAFLPHVRANGGGHILNTASLAGHLAGPGMGVYASSKFAVVGYSEALRHELAPEGIGVSVLCPAWVRTAISDSHLRRPSGSPAPGETDANVQSAVELVASGLDPDELGDWVVTCLEDDRFWIFTHPEYRELLQARHAEIDADWAAAALYAAAPTTTDRPAVTTDRP